METGAGEMEGDGDEERRWWSGRWATCRGVVATPTCEGDERWKEIERWVWRQGRGRGLGSERDERDPRGFFAWVRER
ncbi:hypothetical protein AAC387_Pa12g0982 [Persea americana]